jgi:hypothetical protein
MKLLPVRSLDLVSDLPPAALADALRGVVGDGLAAPFAGSVGADRFFINKINDFRSTAMPRLLGSLAAAPGGGTAVRLRLRPPATVVVFMAIWLGFLCATFALLTAAGSADPGRSGLWPVAPAGVAAGSWLLMVSVFDANAGWAIRHLQERVPLLRPAG